MNINLTSKLSNFTTIAEGVYKSIYCIDFRKYLKTKELKCGIIES